LPQSSRYLIVETTDLKSRTKSFKVYERVGTVIKAPIAAGLPTREAAEAKMREMEEKEAR